MHSRCVRLTPSMPLLTHRQMRFISNSKITPDRFTTDRSTSSFLIVRLLTTKSKMQQGTYVQGAGSGFECNSFAAVTRTVLATCQVPDCHGVIIRELNEAILSL